ncbi:MAG: nucleoside triphosphate pyrophosphohydrolase [Gammaproteobacteria bacterium]|jgi:MazG family protein|nr:nucleoside triphosphate pyrophosphohydrolase [Gammaproteobacteria bacterium]
MATDGMQRLLDIMVQLRHPDTGCAWDLKQDYRSILPHTLEEAYEVADAIESGDRQQLCDELGDLLFQVVFYCQLAREEGAFEFADVAQAMADKLVRRHPHVFADKVAGDSVTALANWEAIKAGERQAKAQFSALDDVPRALPGLQRAAKLQKRAANVGFDWASASQVMDKLDEEVAEVHEAFATEDTQHILEELGDIMFVVVNMCRHLDADPEQVMRAANEKFEVRFRHMEAALHDYGKDLSSMEIDDLEAAWQSTKKRLKQSTT